MEEAKRDAVLAAVEKLKTCPFKATGIKVEMEGELNRSWDTEECEDWFKEHLSDKAKAALVWLGCWADGGDTEISFTLRLDDPTNILLLPEFIDLFNELSRVAGNGHIDVSNAGMHMALLNDSQCRYPGTDKKIDWQTRLGNMKKSCSLLMPALYFLGSTYENTRSLNPRAPGVSTSKYHAIAYREGCLEFRVFDTCYEQPGIILDNVVVMANVMQFFSKTYKPVKMGVNQVLFGKNGRNGHQPLADLFITKTHFQLLNAGLRVLKPSYYTVEEVKAQRKFGKSEADCADVDTAWEAEAKTKYAEYLERQELYDKARVFYARADFMERGARMSPKPAKAADVTIASNEHVKKLREDLKKQHHTLESFKKTLPQPKVGDFVLEGE